MWLHARGGGIDGRVLAAGVPSTGGRLGGVIAGKRTARFDDFAEAHVERFDGVGSVDDAPELVGKAKNGITCCQYRCHNAAMVGCRRHKVEWESGAK